MMILAPGSIDYKCTKVFVVTNSVSAFSQQNSADPVKMLLLLITVPVMNSEPNKVCLGSVP